MVESAQSRSNVDLQPDTIIVSERAFEAATLLLITQAERELMIFDPDLSRGGYQSLQCYEALRDFLVQDRQNRLVIVMHEPAFFSGHCPRLQDLFQAYSHSISIYLTDESARVAQDSFVLADKKHYLHRFHVNQARFKYVLDNETAIKPLMERFDQLLEASNSAIFATSTGL